MDTETKEVENRQPDRQRGHKGFLILPLAHALFTSSCAPKVLLKTGAVEERVARRENHRKKEVCPLRAIKQESKTQNTTFKA